eukprot:scaffold5918_cov124-Isochrysis_galbana.AAC.11
MGGGRRRALSGSQDPCDPPQGRARAQCRATATMCSGSVLGRVCRRECGVCVPWRAIRMPNAPPAQCIRPERGNTVRRPGLNTGPP